MFILCTLAPRIDDFLTMYPILSLSLPFIPVRENHVVSALTLNVRNLLFAPPKHTDIFHDATMPSKDNTYPRSKHS